ncbi:MAG: hypothetical protein IMY67_04145 [Bacteroidetes bacterium]|nr:hypothetical protein [Bacteroidota bacterium]
MKKIIKSLLSLMLVVSFNSCTDGDTAADEVLNTFETGAILRTLEVISNTLNSSDPLSAFSVSVEEQDAEDGALFKAIHVYVSIKDLSPDNGTTVANDMFIKTIDASAFSPGPHGLPRGIVTATFGEAESAMGLNATTHAPGDVFIFELRVELTDGRIYGADSAGGSVTGGFFDSPFKYNTLILCSPEPGVYTVDMHDSYGDGWQTNDGNSGDGIQITMDGVVTQVGMCSAYSTSFWLSGTECTPNDGYDASATVTIPVGTEEATWFFPGDAYGEISFEIYGPNGEELYIGAQGATSAGLLPIALCASN